MTTGQQTLIQIVIAVVALVLAVKFIGILFGFIINHPYLVMLIAVGASVGAGMYFWARPQKKSES